MSENKHGGKRANAGAKPKYGEKTKAICVRVPASLAEEVKKMIYNYIKISKGK